MKTTKIEYKCDCCSRENIPETEIKEISFQVGWEQDPAGGSSIADTKEVDICINCMAILTRTIIRSFDFDAQHNIYELIKHHKDFKLELRNLFVK